MTTARRALSAVAIVLGLLSVIGAGSFVITSARESEENQHEMKCLAAYVAFIEVIGGSEEERIGRLKTCERSRIGEKPIHLDPREHPFVVEKYESCSAAHLSMPADLQTFLNDQRQFCR